MTAKYIVCANSLKGLYIVGFKLIAELVESHSQSTIIISNSFQASNSLGFFTRTFYQLIYLFPIQPWMFNVVGAWLKNSERY